MLRVNEIFYSLQGEGVRTGTANVFVRFSGCNLACDLEPGPRSPGGWVCDTEFVSGRSMEIDQLMREMREAGPIGWCVLTGGEPGLQVTGDLLSALHGVGWRVAIETNGTIPLPPDIDWVTVSPKVAESAVRQLTADEVKYVRGFGQGLPRPQCEARHWLVSPAFNGDHVDPRALEWCVVLVKKNPEWRLSVQAHKGWRVR